MKTTALLQVFDFGLKQDYLEELARQKNIIENYCNFNKISISNTITLNDFLFKDSKANYLKKILSHIQPDTCLIISDLHVLGRKTLEIFELIEQLLDMNCELILINANILHNNSIILNKKNIYSKRFCFDLVYLFAEVDRFFGQQKSQSLRERAKEKGSRLGRREGSLKSKLDDKRDHIIMLISMGVKKYKIAENLNCYRQTLDNWIDTRKSKDKLLREAIENSKKKGGKLPK